MKRTKLNLLTNREDYQRIENIFFFIRVFFYLQIVLLTGIIVLFFMILINQNKKNDELSNQKIILFKTLKDKENDEVKLLYLQDKYQNLMAFLKDDARSLPYYNLLNSALAKSTESATLKVFSISKNRDVVFTVSFGNIDSLLSFFRFIESDEFLKNFESVSLKSFSALGEGKTKENYELAFAGRFIELHETKN